MRMDSDVIIHGELGALVTGEHSPYSLFVLVPTVVFQRRDVEERVRTGRVKLRDISGIQSGPAIPDFLQVGSVGGGTSGSLLRRRLRRLRETQRRNRKYAQRKYEKTLHVGFLPESAKFSHRHGANDND